MPKSNPAGLTPADIRRAKRSQAEAKKRYEDTDGLPEKETTIGEWKPRNGSLYWYPMNVLQEITVYPNLFGQARLVRGRRDDDTWEIAYDYPNVKSAIEAAEAWDGRGNPGHGWIKKIEPSHKQGSIEEELS